MGSVPDFRLVGKPIERVEDLRLLRGRGQYVDDLHRDGMLHAAILRSPVAHGKIVSLNTHEAKALPGVRAVFTAEDVSRGGEALPTTPLRPAPLPELEKFEQPVIAHGEVHYVGEPLAVVVADTLAQAEDALEAIELDIEPLPAITARRAGMTAIRYTAVKGDGLNVSAPYVRRERFSVQRHTAVCLEPRGLLAHWDGAQTRLTVAGGAKGPFAPRRPRAVKWTEDRRENLLASNHSREMDCEIEIACERDGRIVALRGRAWVDMGAYMRANGSIPPRNVAQFLSGPYRIPNIPMESFAVLTNKTPVGTYRGPGRFEADFFRERLFDMAAKDLGLDPVEFRRRNLPAPQDMPYPLATLDRPEKKEELDSGDYERALQRCLDEFGYSEKKKLQGELIDGRYHGIGVTCFIEGGAAGPRESARIVVDEQGQVSVFVGSASVGQGLETVCLQIASDALGLPMGRLAIFHGSHHPLKERLRADHSRPGVTGGAGSQNAAKELRAQITRKTGRDVPLSEIDLKSLGPLSAEGTFHNHKHTYAYGAAAAHVAVDPKTGQVELIDYVTVEDIGKIINPLTATGQAVGAVVQGLGGVFLEQLQYDEHGQFLTASLADYLLPSATDFPRIRAFVTEEAPSPVNPMGAKGAGEGGIVPVGGVVANAVAAALAQLGIEPRSLPLSPPKLWELIHRGPPG